MSQKRPPYLHKTTTRHGATAWYVWKRPGPKIRIRGDYGSKAFMDAYKAALWGERPEKAAERAGSLGAVIEAYRRSGAWARLAATSRRQRDNMLDRVARKIGEMPIGKVSRAMIVETRDSLKPGAAHHFVFTMRGLFKWAQENGYVDDDPTQGVKVAHPKTDGFHTWTDAEIAAFERQWPVGTRERLGFAILLHTGLRISDAVRASSRNIVDGERMEIVAAKTGTPVILPLHPELKAVLDASPLGNDSFIGMSWDTFGRAFKKACDEAGVKGRAHGLRKAAATRLAEAGASVPELNSVFGWTGAKMALKYTQKADRARLARQAIERASVFSPTKGKNN
jgi:integrase